MGVKERTPIKGISASNGTFRQLASLVLLLLLTALAMLVHGYHLGAEDDAIYLPAIKKNLNSALYPHDSEFFLAQTRRTLFDEVVALSVRLTQLPVDVTVFSWQFASIFLALLGCLHVGRRCFAEARAQWGAVATVASLLTLPVAGTALYLVDQHLHPRTLAAAFLLFAVCSTLDDRLARAIVWSLAAFAIHPLMALFGVSYLVFLKLPLERFTGLAVWPLAFAALLHVPSPAWREATSTREYYFLLRWTWYEWLGIFAPLVLLWWFSRLGRRLRSPVLIFMSQRLIIFGLFYFSVAAAMTIPSRFEVLTPLQPMRYLHLLYVLFFLIAGGLLAQWVLRNRWWRWVLLFLPLCAGMFSAQRKVFPSSNHIEWPGAVPSNHWVQAFIWIRQNTPQDALFALGSHYMQRPGEDNHGFRALAERSMLADYGKDAGVVSLAPALAARWQEEIMAQAGWEGFGKADFDRLKAQFGVTWLVLEQPPRGLICPYRNPTVLVCRID